MSDSAENTATQNTNKKASAKDRLEKRKNYNSAFIWQPYDDEDHEDTVSGEIVGFQWVPTENPNWPDMPILYIQEEDRDEWTALPSMHRVLQNELGRVGVSKEKFGETIYVSYLGEGEGSNGTYHKYVVAMEEEEEDDSMQQGMSDAFNQEQDDPFSG